MNAYDRTQAVVWVFLGLFLASFAILGVWDLVLIARGQLTGNSASRVIQDFARNEPVWLFFIALILGVLVGHFFWGQKVP